MAAAIITTVAATSYTSTLSITSPNTVYGSSRHYDYGRHEIDMTVSSVSSCTLNAGLYKYSTSGRDIHQYSIENTYTKTGTYYLTFNGTYRES